MHRSSGGTQLDGASPGAGMGVDAAPVVCSPKTKELKSCDIRWPEKRDIPV